MTSGDSPRPARMVGPSSPVTIRRTSSSQSGLQERLAAPSNVRSAASSGTSIPRQQSTQERISEILEVGSQRASSMYLQGRSPRRISIMPSERDPPFPNHADEPDERTNLARANNTMNYRSTQTTPSLRGYQPSPQPEPSPAGRNGSTAFDGKTKRHWLWDHLDSIWSIELDNTGSVARDHLALERTFLAWLRTSLAFASIGIAVTQLFRLNTSLTDSQTNKHLQHIGKPLGATFIGISILVLLLGYHRFHQPQQWLMKGKFPASRGSIVLISLVAFALMVASLVVVVVV
ncbi:hypothetical protein F5B18DRAFT_373808 [Nemania serpens]|nr:hypothetical protein F5B18DRAFT_373808 [Nemania serpens]